MNKNQYNNVIDYTLKHELSEQSYDSLTIARAIFNNMGVALPQGDINTVYKTIKTNNYMGWRSCTLQEAQAAADNGTAAIGISEDKIVVMSSINEEAEAQASSKAIISKSTLADPVDGLLFYSYTAIRTAEDQYGATWSSLDAAMDYYGRDFTYTYCGGYYNYYYTFADGSRMYFRVA